jgi:hypothetical protein
METNGYILKSRVHYEYEKRIFYDGRNYYNIAHFVKTIFSPLLVFLTLLIRKHLSVKIMEKTVKNMLTEEMIPIAPMEGGDHEILRVSVDGYNSGIFIAKRWGSDKIVIKFDELHPIWEGAFATKYFFFEKPGEMSWGHNGEKMAIHLL